MGKQWDINFTNNDTLNDVAFQETFIGTYKQADDRCNELNSTLDKLDKKYFSYTFIEHTNTY